MFMHMPWFFAKNMHQRERKKFLKTLEKSFHLQFALYHATQPLM